MPNGRDLEFLESLLAELGEVFRPLKLYLQSPETFAEWLSSMGLELDASGIMLDNLQQLVVDVIDSARALRTEKPDNDSLVSLANAALGVTDQLRTLDGLFSEGLPSDVDVELVAMRIGNWLLASYLRNRIPALYATLELAGIIHPLAVDSSAASQFEPGVEIMWENLGLLLSNPGSLFEQVYGWGGTSFDAITLLSRMRNLALVLGILPYTVPLALLEDLSDDVDAEWLERVVLYSEHRLPILEFHDPDLGYAVLGLRLYPVLKDTLQGESLHAEGIGIGAYMAGNPALRVELSSQLAFEIIGQIAGGLVLEIRPGQVDIDGDITHAGLSLKLDWDRSAIDEPLLGSRDGVRLDLQGASMRSYWDGSDKHNEVGVEIGVRQLYLVLATDKADSFLSHVLPPDGIQAGFDCIIGWSTLRGVYFVGSSSLEITLPLHLTLGPIVIQSLYISIEIAGDGNLILKTGFSLAGELGPVAVAIERVGLVLKFLYLAEGKGNVGPFEVTSSFLPPTGAGFAIDTGVLVGGGFLDFDTENERYSGVLALQLGNEIGITAIGLITTRMPDGSEGFSMLVNIGITFDPAIQIYMGFTLAGVGGLVGVNRTMKTDVLRDGLKKGTLDSILFPDPATVIANAAQIISDMRAVFPPEEGRFVIGPMIMIGWGTPTVVTGEIGVFIELPEPVRIALMGQVEMGLPEPDRKIVGIHMDILGVLDLEKKNLSFQASLYGSSLAVFELQGDCAFLVSWGGRPEFGLAIGGFHPAFRTPPPPTVFADLRRLQANINYGPVVQLRLSGYLALTPNTFQFGAKVEVFVGISAIDVGISGFISFDALVIFSPFSFEARVGSGMAVSVLGQTLADIRVDFILSGPTPWNMRGTGTVNVLGFDVDLGFDVTWGRHDPTRLDPVNPWPRLEEALQRAESWGSRLPPAASRAVALRKIEDDPTVTANVIVHPAGMLEIRQNVAPLEVTLAKFGNAPIKSYDQFRIAKVTTENEDELDTESVDEFFARGQFEQMSRDQKLSAPSFEKMQAGVRTRSSGQVAFTGEISSVEPRYDTILIKPDRTSQGAENPDAAISKWSAARFLAAGSAARRCALRAQGHARFAHRDTGMIGTREDKYVLVDTVNLQPVELDAQIDVPAGDLTRTQADQVLAQHLSLHPDQTGQLMVVAEYEVEETP
jgi:hypothetical protein